MPRSFRLDPDLERRLAEAAARRGVPISVFIRDAVSRECDVELRRSLRADLGDLVGSVDLGTSDRSARTGRAFAELLNRRQKASASAR